MLNLFSATMMRDYTEHIGHILAVTSLLILLEVSRAFQPGINDRIGSGNENANADQQAGMSPVIERALRILPEGKGPFGGDDDDDQTTLVDVDLDQAQDFANHFGKYSYEQIERMRNGEWLRIHNAPWCRVHLVFLSQFDPQSFSLWTFLTARCVALRSFLCVYLLSLCWNVVPRPRTIQISTPIEFKAC